MADRTWQRGFLEAAETLLKCGSKETARRLGGTPYRTYNAWKNGRNPMPGIAMLCVELYVREETGITLEPTLDRPRAAS